MKNMKRNGINMIMSMFLLLILASCNFMSQEVIPNKPTNYIQEGTENNMKSPTSFIEDYQPEVGDITVYNLSRNAFKEFLLNPSVENLSAQCDSLSNYRKHVNKDGYIQQEIYRQEGHVNDQNISGFYRIGSWPVYTEFIDFMNDSQNFRKILLDHNIDEEIMNQMIITHSQYEASGNKPIPPGTAPIMCIWIHTDKGDYFLEFNANLYENPNDKTFLFDFYDLVQYEDKYGTD